MGGFLSYFYTDPAENVVDPKIGFSRRQKNIIKHTWDQFIRANLIEVGVDAMLRLFAAHPEIKDVFVEFREIPDSELKNNRKFHVHCQMIMGTLNHALDAFLSDDVDLFATILTMSGERHAKRRIQQHQFECVKKPILASLQARMESQWTDELTDLWSRAVTTMIDGIIRGLNDYNNQLKSGGED